MFPRDPNSPGARSRSHAITDANAAAAKARQETIAQAFIHYMNGCKSQMDTRIHGVLYRRRIDPHPFKH